MADQPAVFILDDDKSVLRAIVRLLATQFPVRPFERPEPFLDALRPDVPGCVLLDLALPGLSGLEIQARLREAGCMQPVVFLSGQASVRASVQAMQAGALDFIEKPWEDDALIGAVRSALERDQERRAHDAAAAAIYMRLSSLTPREIEVFRHVIAGRLNKQTAARLGTAEKTIKVHRARVMQKMAVRSVAELTRVAELAGIRPEP
jgi:FixJ family two-component response regulator